MSVRRMSGLLAGVILLTVTGCGGGEDSPAAAPTTTSSAVGKEPTNPASEQNPASAQPAAKDTPATRTKVVVDAEGAGAGNGLCTLFSTAEMSERLGLEVEAGQVGGPLDSACQWNVIAESGGNIAIQRVPASYWSAPTMGKDYHPLAGVGTKAYTAPGMFPGEWAAAALHGKVMTMASLVGPKASAASAAALLKEALARG
jgi:hypothetical protein